MIQPSVTITFRVRHYECDLYEHVNNAIYFRYLGEAALYSLAEAGYSLKLLKEQGLAPWFAYTDLEYLQPLRYGDTVEVEATITGSSPPGLVQSFEVRANEKTTAARAQAKTVFINKWEGSSPANLSHINPHLSLDGLPLLPQAGEFPSPPPAPPGVFRQHRSVGWQDVNADGQVDPAVLLNYIEECAWAVVAAHGWSMERMLDEGFAILIRRNQLAYQEPARLGDEIEISTWAYGLKRALATRHYAIRRVADGILLAQNNALGVWVNLAKGRPMRFPPGFMEDFAANLAD